MELGVRLARSSTIAARLASGDFPAEARTLLRDLPAAEFDRLVRAGSALDWFGPVDRALASGRELPPALSDLVADVWPAGLDPVARPVFDRAIAGLSDADLRGDPSPSPSSSPPPRRRLVRVFAVIAVVALGAVVVAVATGANQEELPVTAAGFDAVCEGKVFPDAAAYEGAGPHPAQLYVSDSAVGGLWTEPGVIHEEKNAKLFSDAWRTNDPDVIQAVACVAYDESKRVPLDQCDYENYGTKRTRVVVPMYRGEYTVVLYEARTGRRLHETALTGTVADCPERVPSTTDGLWSRPAAQQYADALARFVDG